jgi:hypothetical protein
MIRLSLFLLPYVPGWARPWLIGIAIGRKPEKMEWRDGKWRFPEDSAKVNKALEVRDADGN